MLNGLIKELKQLNYFTTTLSRLLSSYQKLKSRPETDFHKLELLILKLKKTTASFPETEKLFNHIHIWLEEEQEVVGKLREEIRVKFARALGEAFAEKSLDLKGQYPHFYTGLYQIKVNFETRAVELFWGPEFLKKLPLNPKAILKEVLESEAKFKQSLPLQEFHKILSQAYQRTLLFQKLPAGSRVPITEVLREFIFLYQTSKFIKDPKKVNFREYTRANFGYNLWQLRQTSQAEKVSLTVATFDTTQDKGKVIFVPETQEKGVRYAYISLSA
jgi:hypothetical protein